MDKKPLISKWLAVGIILLFVGIAYAPAMAQSTEKAVSTSKGTWLYVGGSGPGNYTTIQDAINTSSNEDTIFVFAGTYYENVIVNKTITLLGEDKNTTIIDGGGIGNVVLVCSDHVNINGFTIQDSGSYNLFDAGVSIHANYTNISNNNITNNNNYGIVIGIENFNIYHHNTIHNNLVSKNHDTNIWIEKSNNNNISNNIVFQDNTRDCICTRYSDNCRIENNMILDSPYGISLLWGSNATVIRNTIKNCLIIGIGLDGQHHSIIGFNIIDNCTYLPWMGHGIRIEYQSSDNLIIDNSISNATCTGIWLYSSSNNNIVQKNTIKNCQYYGISLLESCNNNKIYNNNYFLNTPDNAYDVCNNLWDNGYPSGGNYWDDYAGIDADGDGIGDTPYNIPGGSNQDLYPLMHSFELYYVLNISLDNHEVNESTPFYVTVKTLAGTIVQDAQVLFNEEIITTDPNGIAAFYSPEVTEDVVFPIFASKVGYTSDNDTILVKNVPEELTRSFIFGKYRNLTEEGGYITIEGVNLWLILFNPFEIRHLIIQYGGPEKVMYLKDTAKVILLPQFIFGFVEVVS